jgi:hypothetical protein
MLLSSIFSGYFALLFGLVASSLMATCLVPGSKQWLLWRVTLK